MTDNSRGLVWLRKPGAPVHAFHASREGVPRSSLCRQYVDGTEDGFEVGSRRVGPACRRCREIAKNQPKIVGEPCGTPQPDGRGKSCRNCGIVIHPTYPGWIHTPRKEAA